MNNAVRLLALNNTLSLCRKSAFYKNRVPGYPLTSIQELKTIPLTTKEDIRNNSPFGMVCVPNKDLYQYHETFGTTGIPASAWLSKEDLLDNARRINMCGINFNEDDIVLIRFPYAISTIAHLTQAAAQGKGACVIPASSRTTVSPFSRIVKLMKKLNVTVLACLPLQATLIAETAEMMKLIPGKDFPNLRAIFTGGEMLHPGRRKTIENIWGVPVYDNYGMTETGPSIIDCKFGVPHPIEDSFIFELLDDDYKEEVKPGQIGNLVITTLTRKATPVIRYITGDRAQIIQVECKCGKKTSLLIRGRKQDVLEVNRKVLDMWDLEEILSHLPACRFWIAGPVRDKLKFIIEQVNTLENIDPSLISSLESKFGIGLGIEYVPKGVLYDRRELLNVGVVGKPKYIYSAQEMMEKAYFNSSKN